MQFRKVLGEVHSVAIVVRAVNPGVPQTLVKMRDSFLEDIGKDAPRFKRVRTEVYLAKCWEHDCVRFDLLHQDHAPADFPGNVLMVLRKGFGIVHPYAPGFEIWVEVSERYKPGKYKPGTIQYAADRELDFLLRSVQFKPVQMTTAFPDDCKMPRGENEAFAYGCQQGAYHMRLKKSGPVHVTPKLGFQSKALSLGVDSAVTSGLGIEPGKTSLGIGCLTGPAHGYVAIVKTDGSWGIARLAGGLTFLGGSNRPQQMLPGKTRLSISCVSDSGKKSTLVSLYVNGLKFGAVEDQRESEPFNRGALYTDTFPGLVVFERFTLNIPPQ